MTRLQGTARQIGATYGEATRATLSERIAAVQSAVSPAERVAFTDRTHKFRSMVESLAPGWLEELRGISGATDLPEDDLLLLNCLPDGFYGRAAVHGCTTFMILDDSGELYLHKNRDELSFTQTFFIKETSGCLRYLAGGSIGDLGVAGFLNEKGLAGANNSGSRTVPDEISGLGLSDCHILRAVAEKAACCEEALEIITRIVGEGCCGQAGNQRGMIFMFVDRNQGLLIENTSRHLVHSWIRRGVALRTNDYRLPGTEAWRLREDPSPAVRSSALRYARADALLDQRNGPLSPALFRAISRDTENHPFGICNDATQQRTMTLSAATYVIRKELTDMMSLGWICNGSPVCAGYFPFYIGAHSTPAGCLDGSCSRASYDILAANGTVTRCDPGAYAALEETLEAEERRTSEHARSLPREEARRLLDSSGLDWVERTAAAGGRRRS